MIDSIDFNNDERCRTVVRRSNARATGKYFSWKTNRMHQFESTAERNAFRFLDCDPAVLMFLEQPCVIRYWMDGILRIHFPDILVHYRSNKELAEVKTSKDAADEEVGLRTAFMERALPAHGYSYRLLVAESLSIRERMRNQEVILRFGRTPLSVFARTEMLARIRLNAGITWADACAAPNIANGRGSLCRLVLEGNVVFDQSSAICAATMFTVNQGGL